MKCDIHPHGFCWGGVHGCVYGSEEACKELASKFEELAMYRHAIGPLQSALERIAAALEERLPPIEDANKIEALQARITYLENHLKIAEDRLRRASLPNLGARCRECGKPILGIGAVAGAMKCLECHTKPAL